MSTTIILFIGRALQAILAFANLKLIIEVLPTHELGKYYYMASITAFLGYLLVNPIGQYSARKINDWTEEKKIHSYLVFLVVFFILASSLFFLSLLSIKGIFSFIPSLSPLALFLCTVPAFLFNSINSILIPLLNFQHKKVTFVAIGSLQSILSILIPIILCYSLEKTATYWLTGVFFSQALISFWAMYFLTRKEFSEKKHVHFFREELSAAKKFMMPLTIATLSLWVTNEFYKIIVEHFWGIEVLAQIGIGLTVALSLSSFIETLLLQLTQPALYSSLNSNAKEKKEKVWQKTLDICLPIYITIAILISAFAPIILKLITPKAYTAESSLFLAIGIWINTTRALSNMHTNVFMAELKTEKLSFPFVTGALFCIFVTFIVCKLKLAIWLIPLSLLLTNIIIFIIVQSISRRIIHHSIKWKRLLIVIGGLIPLFVLSMYLRDTMSLKINLVILVVSGIYSMLIIIPEIRQLSFFHPKK